MTFEIAAFGAAHLRENVLASPPTGATRESVT
jgi:hypothetical protein